MRDPAREHTNPQPTDGFNGRHAHLRHGVAVDEQLIVLRRTDLARSRPRWVRPAGAARFFGGDGLS